MPVAFDQHSLLYEGGRLMQDIKQYLLSVTAAAIICGITVTLAGKKSTSGAVTKLIAGLILAVTVVSPLVKIKLQDLSGYISSFSADAAAAVEDGAYMATQANEAIIKSQTEAYILDKATSMDMDIAVEVELCDAAPAIPSGVTIRGAASPYEKKLLQQYIAKELGIPEENQSWI